jgi:hypothetical protein
VYTKSESEFRENVHIMYIQKQGNDYSYLVHKICKL